MLHARPNNLQEPQDNLTFLNSSSFILSSLASDTHNNVDEEVKIYLDVEANEWCKTEIFEIRKRQT